MRLIMPQAHIPSWYSASAHPAPEHPPLRGSERADVVVLGGGICGLSTAIELAERGYSVVVLEGERVGWGASGRSGGQAIFGYGCEMGKIASQIGIDDARKLFDWSVEGVDLIAERCRRYAIDCDLRPGHAHAAIKPRQVDELKHWQEDLIENYGYTGTELWDRARLQQTLATERYAALLYDPRSAHIHPLNYTLGLARAAVSLGVRIFEGSRVTRIVEGSEVVFRSDGGEVRARFGVLAGNAWLSGLVPQLEDRIMPVGTYICASQPLGAERAQALIRNGMAVADINFVLDYFRLSSDHRMLFGGRVSYSGIDPPALGPAHAHADAPGLSATEGCRHRLCLGRLCRHQHEPRAALGAHRSEPVLRPGILRAWHRRDGPRRAGDRRGHPRPVHPPGPVRAHPAPQVPGRPRTAHACPGAGDAVVPDEGLVVSLATPVTRA
jgi:gamma-glutamylputrescine oxidase